MTSTVKPRQSIRYDTVTKRKLKVTVSETGAVKEKQVQSKIRDLKLELRKKNRDKINTRCSEKEEVLKVMRERKDRELSNESSQK
jgi:phosphomannomutase